VKAIHQRYTLILVTDELSPVRRMQVSRNGIRRVVGTAIALAVLIAVGLVDYVRLRVDAVDVVALRAETGRQHAELVSLGGEVGSISLELDRLRELERKVRVIANLPGAMREARVPEPAGKGGAEEAPVADPEELPGSGEASARASDELGASPLGGLDAAALARVQSRARELGARVPTRKLSLEDLLEGLEGKSQRLASTPAIWPTDGYVTSGYGNRTSPFTGRRQFHAGLDIAADFGTTVVAPARGRVRYAGMKGPFGRLVELDHGYGIRTHYAHLSKSLVNKGQTVERGTPIGDVGSTGRSTGPHLHYGVEVEGRTADPTDYIFE
jgi:murein DD-endopeptidase MepM/ murein hydrolase activator NlpD